MRTYRLIADFPWPEWHTMEKPDITIGQVVYEFQGPTYGCTSPDEIAVSVTPGEGPFYGIPAASLEDVHADRRVMERLQARCAESARAAAWRMITDTDIEVADAAEPGRIRHKELTETEGVTA